MPWREVPRAAFDEGHPAHAVVAAVRLPRIAGAAVIGAALAAAGLLVQTAVGNALADAGLLGVSAGGGLAAMLVLTLRPEWATALPLFAFAGSLAAIGVVLAFASARRGPTQPLRLLLAGVALQSMLFAAIALLTFLFADRAPAFAAFAVGSLAATGWRDVALAAPPVVAGLLLALALARPLDLLLLDDASAAAVGVRVQRARFAAAGLGALLAGSAVAVAGLVGFVGLIVPNAARLLIGPGHRALVPVSALGGALLVVLADLGARRLVAPVELPVGALMALVGGPFFLWLLERKLR